MAAAMKSLPDERMKSVNRDLATSFVTIDYILDHQGDASFDYILDHQGDASFSS